MSAYIYIDCEYSGFFSVDLNRTGELLQLGARAVINGTYAGTFNEYCKPLSKRWSAEAEKVHRISRERAEMFQHPNDMAESFLKWVESLGDHYFTIKAFNGKGDKQYVERLMFKSGNLDKWYNSTRTKWVDVLDKAKQRKDYLQVKNMKLETLCKYFSIEIDAHDALSDVDGTIKLDYALDAIKLPKKHVQVEAKMDLTEGEKIKKYMSSKYVQIGGRGDVYIRECATEDPEALQTILSELYLRYCSDEPTI